MRFTPSYLGSLITASGQWSVELDRHKLRISTNEHAAKQISYPSIIGVTLSSGLIWNKVTIKCQSQEFILKGITESDAKNLQRSLKKLITAELSSALKNHHLVVSQLVASLRKLLNLPRFLSHRDVNQWIANYESNKNESIKKVLVILRHPYAPKSEFSSGIQKDNNDLLDVLSGDFKMLTNRNRNFVEEEMRINSNFFDSVEQTPLTKEQRIASIVMQDRNLLVAAAGSGKTSTVVGKIGYALLKGLIKREEVLVLAFNNHAARELEERIESRLRGLQGNHQIKVKTFHALGMDIIADTTGKKPTIANSVAGGEVVDSRLMSELVNSLKHSNPAFALQWLLFVTLCRKPAKNPAEFNTVKDWQDYIKQIGDYRDGKSGLLTMNGELVKSHGEQAIANWLFMNGVDYEYERAYQYETADRKYRQYKPDFYFHEIKCYLEHYALDKKGNPPKAFGDKYSESIIWKRHLHATKGTDVFETTFDEYVSGVLFGKLESELTKRGLQLKPRSEEEIIERLQLPKLSLELGSLLRTFIKHAKSNELDHKTIQTRSSKMPEPYRAILFANIASSVLSAYDSKLKSQKELDFEDLIVDATRHAASKHFQHPYKLILVDEFQDISRARSKLLLSLLDKAPECQLFAVGDDWQSIYRFAGSDICIFTNFENIFGCTEVNYLSQTFRSNQGIADLAARFVQQNPSQMKKVVVANDKATDNVVVVKQYAKLDDAENLIEIALSELSADAIAIEKPSSVFILGRYRHQSPGALKVWQTKFSRQLNIEYRTIHTSKGLQADFVIIIGLHSGNSAFPSEVADDPILQMVMPDPEGYPYAEERRLMYVALTRAKHKIYLIGGKYTPSCFLREIGNELLHS
jgi:DNA helicase-4